MFPSGLAWVAGLWLTKTYFSEVGILSDLQPFLREEAWELGARLCTCKDPCGISRKPVRFMGRRCIY